MTQGQKVRIATIGTSGIAQRFLDALAGYEGATYAGAYSRDLGRARAFSSEHGGTLAFDSLDELCACPDADAVYISSPNAVHASQALACVRAGKHVLVEKAFASNAREAKRVFDAAAEQGVVAMEAMRSIHTPGFRAVVEALPQLGEVRLAQMGFAKVTSRISRLRAGERLNVFDPRLAGGSLMDIGIYCVEPAMALFERPSTVSASLVTTQVPGEPADSPYRKVDLAGAILLGYGDKVVTLSFGKVSDDLAPCQVEGERATLIYQDITKPHDLRVVEHVDRGMTWGTVGGNERTVAVENPENDMVCELADFCEAVNGDAVAIEHANMWADVTLASLEVMDEARAQAGIRFPADDEA
ncbi:gfo/Idh/MocA family oxidoreductase [Olsenella sp. AF16-14LB]|jgi:predicted dehydrogenase|uniref:Gfo/Idh/MocA family protein n=1 Tax=Atopobiaceae TaxID=1643824 RepID=UPI0005094F8A|nr:MULTISPECIES: Gfo/Idh/MocA family oxidoreductase [unclassified Olsenella]RGU51782.1 gfo/Idh/MocA family oxidoreductase [Olsenella sp. AF16-14LB]RGU83011.1 gfo/Idh/MocA family oxidoreductase [Olsenella sp. AF15-43LB]RHB57012.1 gfo/Idh/MocA family oxidoreductase [Olsenella sp. AM39-30AC]RHD75294.1 gfo/Idh/MocA family oxidoreductase [Olsenella sp. AM30-3LB]